ncbi:MAG: electron transfer flavoprotein subunit alpha/FixB family protein, partial [Acidimicrobiia bacterium]|nr:electron transfer flavoprotein subunit alpha/FixB family protein [Acidimicrobiia bacterium]
MSVLVLIEHDRGGAPATTWQAATRARRLAEALGEPLEALIVGGIGEHLGSTAAEHGASTVHVARHDLIDDYGPEAWGAVLAEAAGGRSAVVAPGTERGNEVLAHAAARLDLPMVANVLDVEPGEPWTVTRVRWGGSLHEHAELEATGPALLSFAANVVDPEPAPVVPEVRPYDATLGDAVARTVVVDREVLSEGMTLATAPVVVGGGRGVGSPEGFEVLEELAG